MSRAMVEYAFSPDVKLTNNEYGTAAKNMCSQLAYEAACEAVQIHGVCGVTKEYHCEKNFRDARMGLVQDGVNEELARDGGMLVLKNYPRGF